MKVRKLKRNKTKKATGAKKEIPYAMAMEIDGKLTRAMQLHQSGSISEAEQLYWEVLDIDPGNGHALNMLGMIALQCGKPEPAVKLMRKSTRIEPKHAGFRNNLGLALSKLNKHQEAVIEFNRAIQLQPDFADAHKNLGTVLKHIGKLPEAIARLEMAIQFKPDDDEQYFNLGNAHAAMRKTEKAIQCYQQSLEINPNSVEAYNAMGNAYAKLKKTNEALASYQNGLRIDPNHLVTMYSIGNIYNSLGEFETAMAWFKKAQQIYPLHAETLLCITAINKYNSIDNNDIKTAQDILNKPDLSNNERMYVHFALGKIYNDCQEFDQAFYHYQKGNRLKHQTTKINRILHKRNIDKLSTIFSKKNIKNLPPGNQSDMPLFIVGMPRSGTTLVEQILGNHPKVHAAGELEKLPNIALDLPSLLQTSLKYPDCTTKLNAETIKQVAGEYESFLIRDTPKTVSHITDKMPYNFLHLGLIAILFPNATVIHCRRHPLDTCISIYFQYFSEGNEYTYDLTEIGFYYKQYLRLMEHWQQTLPINFFEIQYEDLVANPAKKSREVIDVIGLNWDDRCLQRNSNKRMVNTASSWQVRQPIYSISTDRWKNYEKHLGPLKKALGFQ